MAGERGLGIVGVHVDDRDVEALREVARVARRAPFHRVGREPDLVVRDHVQRAAGRVAVDRVEVERLRDDALPGERGVAVDEDRQRDRRVVDPGARRAVGLLGARETLDHGVDGLEVARVRRERDLDLAGLREARLRRGEVVLHVPGPALRIRDERVDRPLALELAQDRRVRAADRVREDVEPAAVRDADDDLVRAAAAPSSTASSSIGTSASRPSIENCFWPMNARRRYVSNASTWARRSRSSRRSSAGSGFRKRPDSIAWRSHTRSAWSEMCSISYAIVPM